MTKVNKVLDKKEVSKLIKAYVKFKKAEKEFKQLKEELTKDLLDGKYFSDDGYVNKTTSTRTYIDTDRLFDEHPEIDPNDYLKEKEISTTTISNLR